MSGPPPIAESFYKPEILWLIWGFFSFLFSFFSGVGGGGGGVSLWLANSMWFSFWPVLRWERKWAGTRHGLGILHLFADLVAENLVPIDLGASDGELPAQSFEGRVRHRLVVLADSRLWWKVETTLIWCISWSYYLLTLITAGSRYKTISIKAFTW